VLKGRSGQDEPVQNRDGEASRRTRAKHPHRTAHRSRVEVYPVAVADVKQRQVDRMPLVDEGDVSHPARVEDGVDGGAIVVATGWLAAYPDATVHRLIAHRCGSAQLSGHFVSAPLR
jgi:hypothetical protein